MVANTSCQLEGCDDEDECMYTLGRMSFDIFYPTNLLCSIQGMFNSVNFVSPADNGVVDHVLQATHKEVAGTFH
eukprot:11515644-Ditylum_brightwellii.AAC.1